METLIHGGMEVFGRANMALAQFLGSTFLSAILDNIVVADFASRGLKNLSLSTLHLFAMSQIAGYALGGCWTHIGSAQSVVLMHSSNETLTSTTRLFSGSRR